MHRASTRINYYYGGGSVCSHITPAPAPPLHLVSNSASRKREGNRERGFEKNLWKGTAILLHLTMGIRPSPLLAHCPPTQPSQLAHHIIRGPYPPPTHRALPGSKQCWHPNRRRNLARRTGTNEWKLGGVDIPRPSTAERVPLPSYRTVSSDRDGSCHVMERVCVDEMEEISGLIINSLPSPCSLGINSSAVSW